jgi:hypothetical protein
MNWLYSMLLAPIIFWILLKIIGVFGFVTEKPLKKLGVDTESNRGSLIWFIVACFALFVTINIVGVIRGIEVDWLN